MKKLLLAMLLVVAVGFAFYGTANAIGGVCSNCHTMHNSQDGASQGGPNDVLLKSSTECLGCHAGAGVSGAPLIDKTSNLTSGGSFNDTIATSDARTHNVLDFANASMYTGAAGGVDNALGDAPPGNTIAGGGLATQLQCAGAVGCHGDHTITGTSTDAMKGKHHAPHTTYKFLWIGADNAANTSTVAGTASSDYEAAGATGSNHNIYSAGGTDSISLFCNNCHDDFHGTTTEGSGAGSSPWKRHPTDIALTGAMASATIDYVNTPFAFVSADRSGMSTTTTTGYTAAKGQVMCLSCHRAHGSANNDLLRFDYNTMNAGGGGTTGCLACHVNQR